MWQTDVRPNFCHLFRPVPPQISFYLLSVLGSDAETPLTATSCHQHQLVGSQPSSAHVEALTSKVVIASWQQDTEDDDGRRIEGGREWEPEGPDCYSLDLDSTWEVVEKVRDGRKRLLKLWHPCDCEIKINFGKNGRYSKLKRFIGKPCTRLHYMESLFKLYMRIWHARLQEMLDDLKRKREKVHNSLSHLHIFSYILCEMSGKFCVSIKNESWMKFCTWSQFCNYRICTYW
jgi:hypothetical protein